MTARTKVLCLLLGLLSNVQAQSLSELREAAGQGKASAQFQLAMQYELLGLPANSLYWLFKAARNGSVTAQYNLYQRYRTGKTVRQDAAKARRWLKAASCSGLVNAQTQLALELEKEDPAQAYLWLKEASKQQYPAALRALERLDPSLTNPHLRLADLCVPSP
ncbi:tetratricopeptide repeat protein [Deinococcus roseus]|uniref:Sel1 repeat family protein n=1 Tax=Deinococcus roseus TaxID=392414 RepID=A0ABQ2DJB0_9DEIO|nr:sel1 repeat family protein [Deinococcus roseus]GGJ58211.1 hypothetical protein GCM10008938_50380 [Deinococcus roseus]